MKAQENRRPPGQAGLRQEAERDEPAACGDHQDAAGSYADHFAIPIEAGKELWQRTKAMLISRYTGIQDIGTGVLRSLSYFEAKPSAQKVFSAWSEQSLSPPLLRLTRPPPSL